MTASYLWLWNGSAFIKAECDANGYIKVVEQNLDADGLIQQSAHHKGYNYGTSAWDKVGITANHELKVAMTGMDSYILKSLFDANSILKADSDDTPEALAVAEQRIIGRITSGSIAALTQAQVRAFTKSTIADLLTDHTKAAHDALGLDHGSLSGLTDDDHTQYTLKSLFDANSILYATVDDTPVALAVAASRILGRKATGDIAAMTETELRALLSLEAADIPNLAATKITSGDLAAARIQAHVLAAINASPENAIISLGGALSGNRHAYMDFIADDTNAYGLRLLRSNTGANAGSSISHAGTGDLQLVTLDAAPIKLITNTTSPDVTVDPAGNLVVGGSTMGTSSVSAFGIFNGTPPASSPANMVQLYAEDVANLSELKARDENGDIATLTPHNFSLFTPDPSYYYPWSFYAKNPYEGKEINVDMEGAIRAIEALSGEQFIYTRDLPAYECEDWEANQRLNVELAEKERIEKIVEAEIQKEIEISMTESFEEIEITERVKTGTKITYEMIESIGTIKPARIDVFKDKGTGKYKKQLKSTVRFDSDTGKFYRFRTREEIINSIGAA